MWVFKYIFMKIKVKKSPRKWGGNNKKGELTLYKKMANKRIRQENASVCRGTKDEVEFNRFCGDDHG